MKRKWVATAAMLVSVVCLSGCPTEDDAVVELEKFGFTNIEVEKDGSREFKYTADRAENQVCTGVIRLNLSVGKQSTLLKDGDCRDVGATD